MGNLKVPNVVGTLKFGCASAAEEFKNIIETSRYRDVLDLIDICRTLNAKQNCGYELPQRSELDWRSSGIYLIRLNLHPLVGGFIF
jgi:hypothetical protein